MSRTLRELRHADTWFTSGQVSATNPHLFCGMIINISFFHRSSCDSTSIPVCSVFSPFLCNLQRGSLLDTQPQHPCRSSLGTALHILGWNCRRLLPLGPLRLSHTPNPAPPTRPVGSLSSVAQWKWASKASCRLHRHHCGCSFSVFSFSFSSWNRL